MTGKLAQRFALICLLASTVAATLSAQGGGQAQRRTVIVTPLLHASPLSDSLAALVRSELIAAYGVAVVGNDVTSSQQRSDSLGRQWTFESLRDLVVARRVDALVDVAAMRRGDSVEVMIVKGKAPFLIIDSYRRSTREPIAAIAQTVARDVTRNSWLTSER